MKPIKIFFWGGILVAVCVISAATALAGATSNVPAVVTSKSGRVSMSSPITNVEQSVCMPETVAKTPLLPADAIASGDVSVSELSIKGNIEGDNIIFTLSFMADVRKVDGTFQLIGGNVAYLRGELPDDAILLQEPDGYYLKLRSRGREKIRFEFVACANREGDWRRASFKIPLAPIREVTVVCDRDDLEVNFPGALNVQRKKNEAGRTQIIAFLGAKGDCIVNWKPEVKKLEAEQLVDCEANSIASAGVGALHLDTILTYRIVQGRINRLVMATPTNLNITQVQGEDIQDWTIERRNDGPNLLVVSLSRAKEEKYMLQINSEMVLPDFPCRFDMPSLLPRDVIRTSGFLMIGADSAIKLLVDKVTGLTQVDQSSFPQIKNKGGQARAMPARNAFSYQFANMPYSMMIEADDIVTGLSAEDRLVLTVQDNEATLNASLELEVRDAPTREVTVETDPRWVVANVSGAEVGDYDVREESSQRVVRLYFRNAVSGRTLVDLRLEYPFKDKSGTFTLPKFKVRGAKSERGYLVVAAEKGIRLKLEKSAGLIEVHTGSTPIRVPDVQMAYRFKEPGWEAILGLERTSPVVHSELFHLFSLGEGVLYGSALITYHISGAPLRELKIKVPTEYRNVEFIGRDIRGWDHKGELWTVTLQEKVIGDYTLLISYDRPVDYGGGEMAIGGVRAVDTESEVGYLALASSANLNIRELGKDPNVIRVDRSEVPDAYALLISDPLLCAYKYLKPPHVARLNITRYETEALLKQVADHVTLRTEISREGETVNTATYYVKNASGQYLEISLPKGAKLWYTQLLDENGRRTNIKPLEGEEGLLVPIPRLRNLNTPVQVELSYAMAYGKLGLFRHVLKLEAPRTLKTPIPFINWTINLPKGYSVGKFKSNLVTAQTCENGALGMIALAVYRFYRTFVAETYGWFIYSLAGLLLVVLGAYVAGRTRYGISFAVGVGVFYCSGGIFALFNSDFILVHKLFDAIISVLRGQSELVFSRTVNLTGETPLYVRLPLVPSWIGSGGSLFFMILTVVAGAWLLFRNWRQPDWSRLQVTLGLGLLTVAVSQLVAGRVVISILIIAAIPLAVGWVLAKVCFRSGCKSRKKREWQNGEDLPPFEKKHETASIVPAQPASSPGFARPGLLVLIAGVATLCLAVIKSQAVEEMPKIIITDIQAQAVGPVISKDYEKSAHVATHFEFEVAAAPASCRLLPPECVMTAFMPDSRYISIQTDTNGYVLLAHRLGKYKASMEFQAPVAEVNGKIELMLNLPTSLKNKVVLKLPEKGMEIKSPNAVYFVTSEGTNFTEATAIFSRQFIPSFSWYPKVRNIEKEKAEFFCEVNSLATFEPGVVILTHIVRYQIIQGEINALALTIPDEMSVTSVTAPGLSTWRFDPEKHLLEAVLQKPASGTFDLRLVTQMTREGLPYDVKLGVPLVRDAARQRGALALAAPDTVQVRVDKSEGLNGMNVSDFAIASSGAAQPAVRRAFRYHQFLVSVAVHAERVLSEIRVEETGSLSVADERIVLSSQLKVKVAKAGIFSLSLNLPSGFEVESLSGQDVSHWDEVKDKERGVIVYFGKPVLGMREINVVLSRMEKGIEENLIVPRISVVNAFKQSGTLVVSAERGVRLTTLQRDGVSELNPRELGLNRPGILAFSLLRPDWQIQLKTDVLMPSVKPEILQRVDLTEGLLKGRVYVQYRIENAGCKVFLLQAPQTNAALTISGNDIAKVQLSDPSNGIWQVTLHNKVENSYKLTAAYQIPFEVGAGQVAVTPLLPVNTETPKGYLTVMSDGRVQVRLVGEVKGLKSEEARGIPASFGVGDLSDAILAYRIVSPDYQLKLSVVRHESAGVLPAQVKEVRLVSVLADDGRMLTQVAMQINVGDLRFLKMILPGKDSRLWSAFVDGKVASPSREGAIYHIPLEATEPGQQALIELMYVGKVGHHWRKLNLEGPKFDLPLANITWTVYALPNRCYAAFGGTLEFVESGPIRAPLTFDARNYRLNMQHQMDADIKKARQVMAEGEQYARQGKQKLAKKSLESAVTYSQGKTDINEDARIQYHNLIKQQALIGLVDRRNAVRQSQNIQQEQSPAQHVRPPPTSEKRSAESQVAAVSQSLSAKDSDSLQALTEKMLRQQEAAAGVSQAIRITLPEHGQRLDFRRSLQVNPEDEMNVRFLAYGRGGGWIMSLGLFALILLGFWLGLGWWKEHA